MLAAMVAVAGPSTRSGFDADVVAFALHLPRRVAEREVSLAGDLVMRLPSVFAALSAGTPAARLRRARPEPWWRRRRRCNGDTESTTLMAPFCTAARRAPGPASTASATPTNPLAPTATLGRLAVGGRGESCDADPLTGPARPIARDCHAHRGKPTSRPGLRPPRRGVGSALATPHAAHRDAWHRLDRQTSTTPSTTPTEARRFTTT